MKYVNGTFYVLFILLLLGVAGLFLASMLPIPGNVQIKIVKSGSMAPAIPTGSIVFVQPAAVYHVGEIITFGDDTEQQIPTTHRIVSVENEASRVFYTTKGDANEEADTVRIAHEDVIGRVALAVPFAGYVLDFARQPMGFTLMIGIPAAIIILDEMMRIFAEVRRMRTRGRPTRKPPLKYGHSMSIFKSEDNATSSFSTPSHDSQCQDVILTLGRTLQRHSIDGIRPACACLHDARKQAMHAADRPRTKVAYE